MTIGEAIEERHTVRQFTDEAVEEETLEVLQARIATLNAQFELNLSLHANEELQLWPGMTLFFSSGVENFIALAGPHGSKAAEHIGYCGADLLLLAQREGVNTWWIGGTYSMKKVEAEMTGELYGVIAFGYGKNEGKPHHSKDAMRVSRYEGSDPAWFSRGVEAALLAPTAMNKQAFMITGKDAVVQVSYKAGAFSDVDRGIIKYFFEQGAGKENFRFADAE
ncbi:MAG: nitroreductase family protein [Stomatobaculum longum]